MSISTTHSFGTLLKQLRKRAGMSQSDLAAALGYSISFVCALEKGQRLPDLEMVMHRYVPALGLQDTPHLATQLVNAAAYMRGERPPTLRTHQSKSLAVPVKEGEGVLSHLPHSPTRLIGRELEVAQISKRLLGHYGRLLTLVGPPGIGKTRLALAVAEHLQPHYDDGVLFVPLATVNNAESMATTILTLLDRHATTTNSPQAQLCAFLQRKAMLLVLDNLEQIGEAAAFIADLLTQCPTIVVLATSRERLYLRAEQRYKVLPLALAAAVELFEERAQSLDPEFVLTPENSNTIAAICHKLDCLPLAIELSVARLDIFSVADLFTQLQDRRLDLLDNPVHDLPLHHQTLRNAIHRSYLLLAESTRPCFCALSVFVGDFDLAAAVAIGCSEGTLQMLHNKSLVQIKPTATGKHRFLLLETIRDYGQEQLQSRRVQVTGGLFGVQQRHAHYFLELAEQFDLGAASDTQKYWAQRLKADYPNIRAALAWALQYKEVESALRFAWALRGYWHWFNWVSEARNWMKPIMALAEQACADLLNTPPASLTEASRQQLTHYLRGLYVFGEFCTEDPTENRQSLERCWALDQQSGVSTLTPLIYHRMAGYYYHHGDYAQHDELQQQCLQLLPFIPGLTERDYKREMAWSFLGLGQSAIYQGASDRAEQYLQQSQQLFAESENKVWATICLVYQCGVAYYGGELGKAQQLLDSCWAEFANVATFGAVLWLYHLAGLITLRTGEPIKAISVLYQGFGLTSEVVMPSDLLNNPLYILLHPLAEAALQMGELERAACLLGAAEHSLQANQFFIEPICKSSIAALVEYTSSHISSSAYQTAYALGYSMTRETLVFMIQQWLNDLLNATPLAMIKYNVK